MRAPRTRALLLPVLLLAAAACNRRVGPDDSWQSIYSGGEPKGWKMCGPGEFVVDDDGLKATGGMGMLWYAEKSYKNFSLKLEWMAEELDDNSGIFVRFPNPGNDPWIAVNQGYEIQICDTAEPKHETGSVYSFQAPSSVPTKPAGQWNEYEITVVEQEYTIKVNGTVVNQYHGDRSTEGYVGMQNHDDGSPVHYRNIRVKEL